MSKARKSSANNKSSADKKKKATRVHAADGQHSAAQNSEYRDLRKRVDARKDAKEILEIAKQIDKNP